MLIVDDLTDTGKTASVVRAMIPRRISPPSRANADKAVRWSTPSSRNCRMDTWIYFPWDLVASPIRNRSPRTAQALSETKTFEPLAKDDRAMRERDEGDFRFDTTSFDNFRCGPQYWVQSRTRESEPFRMLIHPRHEDIV